MQAERVRHNPIVVVDTTDLSEDEWKECRRLGIGGSDVAAIFGVSPFATKRDLYYDKLNIAPLDDVEENWVALEVGKLLEPLVAKIFKKKINCKLGTLKKIMRHPKYPFMQANIDYLIVFPDDSVFILECKTTNHNMSDKWFDGDAEIIPFYYELQGYHYMAVMDVDRVYFCCLYGNNENDVIIRRLDRDMEIEAELIAVEEDFWLNNVLAQVPPEYTEPGELIAKSVKRHFGTANPDAPEVELKAKSAARVAEFLMYNEEKLALDRRSRQLKSLIDGIKGHITDEIGTSCVASCSINGEQYIINCKPSVQAKVLKDDILRMREVAPDAYNEFVTIAKNRRFDVKPRKQDAAVESEAVAA